MGWKPRTSPYDFQGLGLEGLKIARQVANKYSMYVVSEIMDKSLISDMSEYTDIFWVGARNMYNSFLLKAMGQVRQPVILKRSYGANIQEFLYAAEYIVSSGNPNVDFDRARHPHFRDLDAQHARHQRGRPAQAGIAPAGGGRYFAFRRAARHRYSAGESRQSRRRGRSDVRMPSQPARRHERRQAAVEHPEMHALLDEILDTQKVLA